MNPALLCELLAALMFEFLDRASGALGEQMDVPPRHVFDATLLPVWMNMLADLDLPLEPPDQEKAAAQLQQLADYLRESAREEHARRHGEGDSIDEPTGVLN